MTFQEKVRNHIPTIGTHISLGLASMAEMFGQFDYDYLWIDTEHTSMSLDQVLSHLIAARAAGVAAIVRVPWHDAVRVKPILEMGPDGVVFPQIRTYEEAKCAVEACMYPPLGNRGFGPRRANRYGDMSKDEYLDTVDERLLKVLQIEHIDAVNDLDRILSLEYADAFVIGPNDLAASMGFIRQSNAPEVHRVIDDVIARILRAGKTPGLSLGSADEETLRGWRSRGIEMVSMGSDQRYLVKGAKDNCSLMKRAFLCQP